MSTEQWDPVVAPRAGSSERRFVRFAPFGALAVLGVLVLTGRIWLAVVLAVVGFGILQARMVSPSFRRSFERSLARAAHAIAHVVGLVLSWTLLTMIFVVVIVPVSILGWVARLVLRRPLGRPRGLPGDGWIPRETLSRSAPPPRMFGTEPTRAPLNLDLDPEPAPTPAPTVFEPARTTSDASPARPRARRRARVPRLVTVLGVVAALLLVDLAGGAILTAAGMPPDDRGDTARQVEGAVRRTMAAPTIADEHWVEEYAESLVEFQLGGETYIPYLVRDPRAFESRYLNTTEAERVSYVPTVPGGVDPVRIAFFGGSVMFGVGQRDDHTIPSEVARLAEDEGIPVEVHNYGLPGWVGWQEAQYLERLLAAGEGYDLVVFYDGYNEFLVQYERYSIDPTHVGASIMDQFASDYHDDHETAPEPGDALAELGSAYARHSAVGRLLDRFNGDSPNEAGEGGTVTPEQQAAAALDVYARFTDLATGLAADENTSVHFFWQPTKAGWDPSVTDRLPAGVTDLSSVLDGRQDDLYIDEVHTNEEGARLMAEALWDELGPELERAAAGR